MDCLKVSDSVQQLYNYAANNDSNAVYSTRDFYREGIKNPTTALLIARNNSVSHYTDLISDFKRFSNFSNFNSWKSKITDTLLQAFQLLNNVEKTKQHPLVQEHQDKFIKEMTEKLYPSSAPARLAIITKGHIVLDKISPKVQGLKKIQLRKQIKKCANDLQKCTKSLL